MHYRAIGALVLSTAVVFTAAGCSNNPSTSADGDTVTLATNGSDKVAAEAIAKAFEEKTGITVKVTSAETDNYQTTLRTQLSSGTAPDVFFTWGGDGNPMAMQVLQEAGLIEDLSGYDFAAEIPEGFRSVTNVDDKTWIAPTTTAGIGAAYNKTAMDENGWTIPTTWSEMIATCGTARTAGKSLFALAGATPWNTQLIPYALAPTLVYGPTPDFAQEMADGNVAFADSAWVDVFDKYVEMQDAGCFQDNALGTAYDDALKLVGAGTAMASVQVNASMTAILQSAPDGTELAFEPLPATDDASSTRMAAALGAAYGVNVKTKNPEGAMKLIEYMTSEEGLAVYAEGAAAIPALPAPDYKLDPTLDTLVSYLDEGKTAPFMDQLWPNAKVQQTHFEVVQQLLAGDVTAVEALEKMDAAYAEG